VGDVDEFIGRLRPHVCPLGPDQMFADVIFEDLGQETVDRAPDGDELMHDRGAAFLGLDRLLGRLHLSADATDPIQKLLLFVYGMTHGEVLGDSCGCGSKYHGGVYHNGGLMLFTRLIDKSTLRAVFETTGHPRIGAVVARVVADVASLATFCTRQDSPRGCNRGDPLKRGTPGVVLTAPSASLATRPSDGRRLS
jgi:hypothetical protein